VDGPRRGNSCRRVEVYSCKGPETVNLERINMASSRNQATLAAHEYLLIRNSACTLIAFVRS
jgi:hypothetical protein